MQTGLTIKKCLVSVALIVVGAFEDLAIYCAEVAQAASLRIQTWDLRH